MIEPVPYAIIIIIIGLTFIWGEVFMPYGFSWP
jgi:hypothetical protein